MIPGYETHGDVMTPGCHTLSANKLSITQEIRQSAGIRAHLHSPGDRLRVDEVSRGAKILYAGPDPESYITEFNLVHEGYNTLSANTPIATQETSLATGTTVERNHAL